jgi:antirestriction protein ArdC
MNIYEIVTERIINLLEQGVIPWRRPWSATGRRATSSRRKSTAA